MIDQSKYNQNLWRGEGNQNRTINIFGLANQNKWLANQNKWLANPNTIKISGGGPKKMIGQSIHLDWPIKKGLANQKRIGDNHFPRPIQSKSILPTRLLEMNWVDVRGRWGWRWRGITMVRKSSQARASFFDLFSSFSTFSTFFTYFHFSSLFFTFLAFFKSEKVKIGESEKS